MLSLAGLVCSYRLNVATVIWRSLVFFDKTTTVAIYDRLSSIFLLYWILKRLMLQEGYLL